MSQQLNMCIASALGRHSKRLGIGDRDDRVGAVLELDFDFGTLASLGPAPLRHGDRNILAALSDATVQDHLDGGV
jgi:hypothetical protein